MSKFSFRPMTCLMLIAACGHSGVPANIPCGEDATQQGREPEPFLTIGRKRDISTMRVADLSIWPIEGNGVAKITADLLLVSRGKVTQVSRVVADGLESEKVDGHLVVLRAKREKGTALPEMSMSFDGTLVSTFQPEEGDSVFKGIVSSEGSSLGSFPPSQKKRLWDAMVGERGQGFPTPQSLDGMIEKSKAGLNFFVIQLEWNPASR